MVLGRVRGLVTPKSAAMQRAFGQAGGRPTGIVPGFDREVTAREVARRAHEAIGVRVLVSPDGILQPRAVGVRPATREPFELMLPRGPQASRA